MKKSKMLYTLFFTMLKIGLFTFGGGYAMIALLEDEFIEKKKWISRDEFLDMAAIAESTPGPIAVNAATYIGYKMSGLAGALVSTVAMCIPSFIIIYVISLFFDAFLGFEYVAYAFKGIQVCVVYLIMSAGCKMLIKIKKTAFNVAVFSVVLILNVVFTLFSVKFSAIYFILISGVLGIAVNYALTLRDGKGENK